MLATAQWQGVLALPRQPPMAGVAHTCGRRRRHHPGSVDTQNVRVTKVLVGTVSAALRLGLLVTERCREPERSAALVERTHFDPGVPVGTSPRCRLAYELETRGLPGRED